MDAPANNSPARRFPVLADGPSSWESSCRVPVLGVYNLKFRVHLVCLSEHHGTMATG